MNIKQKDEGKSKTESEAKTSLMTTCDILLGKHSRAHPERRHAVQPESTLWNTPHYSHQNAAIFHVMPLNQAQTTSF